MFINREWAKLLPDNPGAFIIFDFDGEPLINGATRNLRRYILCDIMSYVKRNFMDIDFHDLARIRYWICENNDQAREFVKSLRERYREQNLFLIPNFPGRNEQQRTDNLRNIPNDNNALTLDLPNQDRGNPLERLIYKNQIINRILMDASMVGLTSNKKVKLEWHLRKLLEILLNI